jgi:hypothetical protein
MHRSFALRTRKRDVSTTKWIALSLAGGALVVAVLSWTRQGTEDASNAAQQTASSPHGVITARVPTAPNDGNSASMRAPYAASAPQVAESPLDSVKPPECRVSERGDLLIDPQTREDVELVAALHRPGIALAKLDEACKDQSPKAKQEMKNLYQQFAQYSQAVTQTFPIEEQNEIPVEKLDGVLLKGLHDLRVQYFGAEKACAMYCAEEDLTKRMLEMAVDHKRKNPKASTEEAVAFAQNEILKQLPPEGEDASKGAGQTK